MTATNDIVARLWNLCHTLRDDGVTYHEYVTELTYLLFLKMAQETGTEGAIPAGWRWADLTARDGTDQLTFYRELLIHLGAEGGGRIQAIYANANTSLRHPRNLAKLVSSIDALDWYSARHEGLGDLYEGLLEKNANETKSGAGQYFTPRPLIEAMVEITKPQAGEIVSDPAAGTLGFITRADRFIKDATDDLFDLPEAKQVFQKREAYYAIELVPDTRRLALMNALLHDIDCEIILGDTLSPTGSTVPRSDVILTNPPFGTKKGGGGPTRDDFTFPTSNKQLAFLQHIYRNLLPAGRAAVVLPDNVLFEDGVGAKIRADLMDKCDLHTILRLPTGIFYAQGVKTNVLFFTKGAANVDTGNTEAVWVYDLRTNMPSFGKRTPFTRAHLQPFVDAYGDDPKGRSPRNDEGEEGRFRRFTREAIQARGDNLDISWLRDENTDRAEDLPEPDELAAQILLHLQTATEEMQALMELLDPEASGGDEAVVAIEERE
ncbi:MAG: N-6 DNA methylase [Deltaproteobacteria bacterium]|nr:N-6 DNA methylase [Deltaproteobacteria bacterium]